MKLRTRIVLLFLILGAAPLVIVGLFTSSRTAQAVEDLGGTGDPCCCGASGC